MNELDLGPNGALLYAMEYIEAYGDMGQTITLAAQRGNTRHMDLGSLKKTMREDFHYY